MSSKTGIEWTDSTWSPVRVKVKQDAAAIAKAKGYTSLVQIAEKMAGRVGQHCEHVSPGCEHCYAETNNHRCLPGNGTGLPYDRRSRDLVEAFVDEKALLQPLKWKPVVEHGADCRCVGVPHGKGTDWRGHCPNRPRRIFVENQSDLFGEWVTDEMRDLAFAVMFASRHTFQVLTKRPDRMLEYFSEDNPRYSARRICDAAGEMGIIDQAVFDCDIYFPLMNVWLGATAEDQAHADLRREPMARLSAAGWRTFASYEPAIGGIDWKGWEFLKWLISGGESGPKARPHHPQWHRAARDFAGANGIAYFFKQWGAHYTKAFLATTGEPIFRQFTDYQHWVNKASPAWVNGGVCIDADGKMCNKGSDFKSARYPVTIMHRVPKKLAGAVLDGREWKQFPGDPSNEPKAN